MEENVDKFFENTKQPSDFRSYCEQIESFVKFHAAAGTKIALVTSGGTTVPLEHNTVRFVDNFSAGTRGSASAEYFLQNGYAVLFLYRAKSLQPFARHFHDKSLLDMLEFDITTNETVIKVRTNDTPFIASKLNDYKNSSKRLKAVDFTTLSDYLWLLKASCEALSIFGNRALLFLAAAVSDFYIPVTAMPKHKMQSNAGPPTITFQLVPKMLKPLVGSWIPGAFVVSFKLETDPELLIRKAREALAKYKHHLVIGNLLDTRRFQVDVVTSDSEITIRQENDQEIEMLIVEELVKRHDRFINTITC